MRVLLDECLPRQLAGLLVGHEVRTVTQAGWSGKKNGELLRLAEGKFGTVITVDRRFTQSSGSYAVNVITLRARSNSLKSLRPLVPEILKKLATIGTGKRITISA